MRVPNDFVTFMRRDKVYQREKGSPKKSYHQKISHNVNEQHAYHDE